MIYGYTHTIHSTQKVNVEVDKNGKVVSVWFRCCALPFDQNVVDDERAAEMRNMYSESVDEFKLNAVDIENPTNHLR